MELIKEYVNADTSVDSEAILLANDCWWYPGVFEYVAKHAAAGGKAFMSGPVYSKQEGTHNYYDGEGYYVVKEK